MERDGDSLLVKGERSLTLARGEDTSAGDLLLAYSRFAQDSKPMPGQLRGGRLVPLAEFVNANTEKDLIEFVRKYGPVNGSRKSPGPLAKDRTRIEVLESLQRLTRERLFFASALSLKAALMADVEGDSADALGRMIKACSQPAPRGEYDFQRDWLLGLLVRSKQDGLSGNGSNLETFIHTCGRERVREYGRYALCLVLNSFPPVMASAKDGLVEMPRNEHAGILPALVFMLRRDCVLDSEIKMCDQRDCGRWFKVERGGQRFCCAECSLKQRQHEYWERSGKEVRAKRLRKLKKRN